MQVCVMYTTPAHGAPMERKRMIHVRAGKGIVGSRWYKPIGGLEDEKHVTLLEAEAVHNAMSKFPDLTPSDPRRNILTEGGDLGELIETRFRIGSDVELEGIERCEPCTHLVSQLGYEDRQEAFLKAFLHTGLRAKILTDGIIWISDRITVL